ncbi:hypothetical protein BT67DRAFT_103932 [Trichocladium antarcticum]|uniref:Uncharacterized protein n=1 Tax=Trichocladium antarcticum TaxID=1450529 RepID=A0AAN6ZH49_9PEZI|nr:hypothetical protein BT67DRAFT_103932 [Trichocladium antarcticum]
MYEFRIVSELSMSSSSRVLCLPIVLVTVADLAGSPHQTTYLGEASYGSCNLHLNEHKSSSPPPCPQHIWASYNPSDSSKQVHVTTSWKGTCNSPNTTIRIQRRRLYSKVRTLPSVFSRPTNPTPENF